MTRQVGGSAGTQCPARTAAKADVAFRAPLVIDGTGGKPFTADVTIRGDRIGELTSAGASDAATVVDATGLVLAPGFIDIHSHADATLLADGTAESCITQGVTSIVPGNCGVGIAPVSQLSHDLIATNIPGWLQPSGPSWVSFGDYLDLLRHVGMAANVFPLVAHGAIRLAVAGFAKRQLTGAELRQGRRLVTESLEAGAIGLSTGLEYAPGQVADSGELAFLAEPLGDYDSLYATHCRNRAGQMVEAAVEAVGIARRARARLQMSHFVRRPYGPGDQLAAAARRVVRQLDREGLRARFDVFPFEYGPTPLASVLDQEARLGSPAEVSERLADRSKWPAFREQIGAHYLSAIGAGIAQDMFVACDGADGEFRGRTLADIASQVKLDLVDTALWLLARAGTGYYNVGVLERWVTAADLDRALRSPDYLLASDGVATSNQTPLSGYALSMSDWGWTATVLGHFVRDAGVLALPAAVQRMTSEPARQLGLADRGTVAPGWYADLVLFDPATVHCGVRPDAIASPATGFRWVLVNGVPVIRDGRLDRNTRPGQVGIPRQTHK
jgi:N-acyl-D-amino-acid deacylase